MTDLGESFWGFIVTVKVVMVEEIEAIRDRIHAAARVA